MANGKNKTIDAYCVEKLCFKIDKNNFLKC